MNSKISLTLIPVVIVAIVYLLKGSPEKSSPLPEVEQEEKVVIEFPDHSRDSVTGQSVPLSIDAVVVEEPESAAELESTDKAKELEQGLEFFEYLASLPGAYDLAWDIRTALEKDPGAIDFSSITYGPERHYELRADYLEQMIKDPDLRSKWIELMDILAEVES